ncbi:acyl dehydratase [Bradyrhizobium sp. USDA 4516]
MQVDLQSSDEDQAVGQLLTYESFRVGQVIELGWISVSERDIADFASQFDPQSFHTDEERARHSPYKGIITSGWHTAGLFMRLYVDRILNRASCLGSPGVDDLRWIAPVRAGQRLRGVLTVERLEPSKSRPDRGTLYPRCELFDEDKALVFSMVLKTLLKRSPSAS